MSEPSLTPTQPAAAPTPNTARSDAVVLSFPEIEAAINYWRARSPSLGDELRLCAQASALSHPYAFMIYQGRTHLSLHELDPAARSAWDLYQAATA